MRKTLSRRVRRYIAYLRWQREFPRLKAYKGRFGGRRAFLVGSGPSLKGMDLGILRQEFVCVVNLGIRGVGGGIPHADMHIVSDADCYRTYAAEIEGAIRRNKIQIRFVNRRVKRHWQRQSDKAARPIFITKNAVQISELNTLPDLSGGIPGAKSVLIPAAYILKFMGFSEVYVIGCDLDYTTDGAYFYALTEFDAQREQREQMARRHTEIIAVNDEFRVVRNDYEQHGIQIFNAGIGGNLHALERVDFKELFEPSHCGPASSSSNAYP